MPVSFRSVICRVIGSGDFMKSKYHSRKVTRDVMTFDSVKEYRRYCELRLLERAGKIANLQRQVKFELLPAQRDERTGKLLERAVSYVADFTYYDEEFFIVEDAKGYKTPEYKLKKKMMLYFHGIKIQEV